MAASLGYYFHTLRHLRFSQLAGRARNRLVRSRPDLRAAPPTRTLREPWLRPCAPAPNLEEAGQFHALGSSHSIADASVWNDRRHDDLWLYNLHYFDDLNAADSEQRGAEHAALLRRWIDENPPGHGIGWQPYPTTRRLVNWIKWAIGTPGVTLPAAFDHSLAIQARWLAGHLEFHIGGNHLLADAKGLLFAGAYFEGAEAHSWFTRGSEIFNRELAEQVLPDGGHYERSPMYHATVLEDLLDVLNLMRASGREIAAGGAGTAARMFAWLEAMTHPDGGVSFFNDAALGIAPSLADLAAYARPLGICGAAAPVQLAVLEPSGYVRAQLGPAWLACDCAPVGPDYLPGHAHADTLSFELSLGAQRVVVNSGTSLYGTGPERQRQRGTVAHNTVVVDGVDSSEVWAGFRVARRAYARFIGARVADGCATIEAAHDGYRRLRGRNEHRRRWELSAATLAIEDHVTGPFVSAAAHFHFHPDVHIERSGEDALRLSVPGGLQAFMKFEGFSDLTVKEGTWHPSFGASIPNRTAIATFGGERLFSLLDWG